ncbi:MAG: 5'-nucleotidase C-terminal domain-containing protein [Sulfitobacter sp.]
MPSKKNAHGPLKGTAKLRVLATTDLHMQMSGFDYIQDRQTDTNGFAGLATLIADARAEALAEGRHVMLFDNGDLLQGTPLGDYLSQRIQHIDHPVAACLNAIGYDAIGLGNHDFDFGLPYLDAVTAQCDMPVVCSNLITAHAPKLEPQTVLQAPTKSSAQKHLNIGLLSVIPTQTAQWNQNHLHACAQVTPPIEALQSAIPNLRQSGADVVFVLAHTGIANPATTATPENLAVFVAALSGVDLIIAGHTHGRFPGAGFCGVAGVDASAGTLSSIPAAMPGFGASDLAVIDLDLEKRQSDWAVVDHKSQLRPVTKKVPPDPRIIKLLGKSHTATRRHLSSGVGALSQTIHSYFTMAQDSILTRMLAVAKSDVIAATVRGGPLEHLPILATASCPATGGMAQPDNFVTLNKGRISRRQIAGLCPYVDQIWALRATGAQMIEWLERSARVFNRLRPSCPDQDLNNPAIPGFKFDTIVGLEYTIDPTQPAKYDPGGSLVSGAQGRIRDVRWRGAALKPDQEFLVATTHYRAAGGGGYFRFADSDIAVQSKTLLAQALTRLFEQPGRAWLDLAPSWTFAKQLGVQAVLQTSPLALDYLDDIAELRPVPCGVTPSGFQKLRLSL